MSVIDLYLGERTWADYLSSHPALQHLLSVAPLAGAEAPGGWSPAQAGPVRLELGSEDYQLAKEAGLGALSAVRSGSGESERQWFDIPPDLLAGGIDQLNADFHVLLGDILWKSEMRQGALHSLLQEIRLAEFEREARAYRLRAQRAYINGWYEEALKDFVEAANRNYPDFEVHRSIATIYLYHLLDLPKALEHFRKAAKYARPVSARHSAEAHYFAGVVSLLERKPEEALAHMQEAASLDSVFNEASYQLAGLSALAGDMDRTFASLKRAVAGDPRYFGRARRDPVFEAMRPQVDALLDQLFEPVRQSLARIRKEAILPRGYVIAEPDEEHIKKMIGDLEAQAAGASTYREGVELLDALSHVRREISRISDLFHKRYEVDPRDYVRCVVFSPDGELLASGFLHGGIRVWEANTGLPKESLRGHLTSVNSLAFSPDSLWLASGSRDKTIKLWEVEGGGEIKTLTGHHGEVRAVAFSPDGQWLVSGSHDRSVRLWRVATGWQVQTLCMHQKEVTSTVFSPDGQSVASGSADKTIKIVDMVTGAVKHLLTGHAKGIASLAFSPDGRWLASGGEDARVKLWAVSSGREIQTFAGARSGVTSLAFSSDSSLLAAGSLGHTIVIWKLLTGELIKHFRYPDVSYNSVAFSPKGQWLALGSRDLELWLKVLLREEEYDAVRAAEKRAAQTQQRQREAFRPYSSAGDLRSDEAFPGHHAGAEARDRAGGRLTLQNGCNMFCRESLSTGIAGQAISKGGRHGYKP